MIRRSTEGVGTAAPPVLPAAVSLALAPLVDGTPRPVTVLGAAGPAAWIGEADEVVVLSSSDAVRLPNSAVVAATAAEQPFAGIRPGDLAVVGLGEIRCDGLRVTAARWFDPVPALPDTDAATVTRALEALEGSIEPMPDHGLEAALAGDDSAGLLAACRGLIGEGDGLTPLGDDLVAGAVAGLRAIGGSLGDELGILRRHEQPILQHARAATTSLSAALLRHAFRGEVAEPAGRLLVALAGRGDPPAAAAALQAVGHSSGPALAAGVVAGARAAIERSR